MNCLARGFGAIHRDEEAIVIVGSRRRRPEAKGDLLPGRCCSADLSSRLCKSCPSIGAESHSKRSREGRRRWEAVVERRVVCPGRIDLDS